MKKLAILTINDYNNYGNRLQNYAAQEVLKSLDFSVETIINNTVFSTPKVQISKGQKVKNKLSRIKSMQAAEIFGKVNLRLKNYVNKSKHQQAREKRIASFKRFSSLNISETSFTISDKNIPADLSEQFDFFVTGSDQVWNPNFRKGSSIDFLTFADKEKRVAYSPSFGISKIPEQFKENYSKWLSEIAHLSVREPAGAAIIKELTGRESTVLVDPTLMLSKEKWMSIAKPAVNKPKGKYMLTYYLGELSDEDELEIRRIAKSQNLEIVNLAKLDNIKYYDADPSAFIDFIDSAAIFMTDSFHGAVFSIILNTPFVVFERKGKTPSMNSRIDNLLSLFQLEERLHKNMTKETNLFDVDYSHVPEILEVERERAFNFLKEALAVEEKTYAGE